MRTATPSQIAYVRDIPSGDGGGSSTHRPMTFAGIALIGLRGAGKSTLGRMLADEIGWSFVELNKEIERQNGLAVPDVRSGSFRRMAASTRAIADTPGIDGAGDRRRHQGTSAG